MRRIVLASASPRRKQLLEQIGLRFEVEPSDYEEDIAPGSEPHEMAKKLSLGKARAAARKHRKALIIAADTFVVFGDRILGKPHTNAEAREMLRALNGQAHSVITGFTILDTETGKVVSQVGGNQGSHEEADAQGDRQLRQDKRAAGQGGGLCHPGAGGGSGGEDRRGLLQRGRPPFERAG